MVSLRCILLVKEELNRFKIPFVDVKLGYIDVNEEPSVEQLAMLDESLRKSGLEVLEDKKMILIERIKNLIVDMVHYSDELPREKYSEYISNKLEYDYTYLSNLFTEVKGITIQQFIIMHKVERIKELLLYDELNITEIAYKLNYSSVAHLSNQFKKFTGLTPSYFKKMAVQRKQSLESI